MQAVVQKNLLIAAIVMFGDMLLSYLMNGGIVIGESLLIAASVFIFFTVYNLYKAKNKR